MTAIRILLQIGAIYMSIEELPILKPCLELASKIEPMEPISDYNVAESSVESEGSASGYDEIGVSIEQEQACYPNADKSNELQNFLNTQQFFKQQLDPFIVACISAILLCNEIKKQRATYLYSWIKSKPNDLIPDHWELIYPETLELIRNFLIANQKLKSPMHLKCEEYDLVTSAFKQILPRDPYCLIDLIKHPKDLVNTVDTSGLLTGLTAPVAVVSNQVLQVTFSGLQAPQYVQRVNDRRKMARRREKKVLNYIDKLREQYSRLVGVRIDLYLTADKKHFKPKEIVEPFHIILQKLRRSKTLHLKGYVTKLEYGIDQALHIHCFFFFCGREHREDISLGRMIGEMWDSQIEGKHSYFNCNASNNRKKYKYDALGVINRDDQTKYDNIAKVIHYFAKFEQYVLHSNLERVKTLNTGVSPHLRNKMGRPNLTQHY